MRHMAVYERAMWHTMYVCASVCARVHTFANVCTSVIREINQPFHDNTISLITYTLYISRIVSIFVMWNYFYVLCAQVMWLCVERSIARFDRDHRSSLK